MRKFYFSLILIFGLIVHFNLLKAQTTILFLGDSLTEGYRVEPEYSYPSQLENKLKKQQYKNFKIINAGISGSTSASAKSRLQWYLKTKIDILFLALGANDGLRGLPISQMKNNLSSTIELAQKNNIKVILAGMLIPPNYGLKYTKDFKNLFPYLQKKYNTLFVPFPFKRSCSQP